MGEIRLVRDFKIIGFKTTILELYSLRIQSNKMASVCFVNRGDLYTDTGVNKWRWAWTDLMIDDQRIALCIRKINVMGICSAFNALQVGSFTKKNFLQ